MKRRCECGHQFDDHARQRFTNDKPDMLYCRVCCGQGKPSMWCIEYKEIDNLKYLEELNDSAS